MQGARLFWGRPELFFRDCAECRTFAWDEDKNRPKTNSHGEPIRLGARQKRNCAGCPKNGWRGFSPENERAFEMARLCIELDKLPRAGGIEDQEPTTMDTLLELKRIKSAIEAADSQAERDAVMAAFGLKRKANNG